MSARRLLVTVLAAAACACSATKASPTAPSAVTTAASLPLTVMVVTRGAETPIAGAAVFKNGLQIGQTDAGGAVQATVEPGVQFHITVTATGYDGNGAWGEVEGPERWTFYLAAQP